MRRPLTPSIFGVPASVLLAGLVLAGCGSATPAATPAPATSTSVASTSAVSTTAAVDSGAAGPSTAGSSAAGSSTGSAAGSSAPPNGDVYAQVAAGAIAGAAKSGITLDPSCVAGVVKKLSATDAATIAAYYASPTGTEPDLSDEAKATADELGTCAPELSASVGPTPTARTAATVAAGDPLDALCADYGSALAADFGTVGTAEPLASVNVNGDELVSDRVITCKWRESPKGAVTVYVAHYATPATYQQSYGTPQNPLKLQGDASYYGDFGDKLVASVFRKQWEYRVYIESPVGKFPLTTLSEGVAAVAGIDAEKGSAGAAFPTPAGGTPMTTGGAPMATTG